MGLRIFIFIFAVLLLLTLAVAGISFAPWVPARKRDIDRIVRLANLTNGEVFVDLGCGNGRVVFAVARLAGITARGVDLAWPLAMLCHLRALFGKHQNVHIRWGNLFSERLHDVDVVFVFGLPKTLNEKLKFKLERELPHGARVLSYAFAFHDWTPDVIDKPTREDLSIYRYVRL